jgi:hypothetical protein
MPEQYLKRNESRSQEPESITSPKAITHFQFLLETESKDPGPEGPALVHPRGVICVITFTTVFSVQVSGVSDRIRSAISGSRFLNGFALTAADIHRVDDTKP